ncbi:MAG: ATP-binding protein [Ignavibacteria bacterium]|nr:ATP-binding protein [Ignavibacteria bacterium]
MKPEHLIPVFADNSLQGIVIYEKGRLIYSNKRASVILNVPEAELANKQISYFIGNIHKDDFPSVEKYFLTADQFANYDVKLQFRYKTHTDKYSWLECYFKNIDYDNEQYLINLFANIDENKKYEERLIENEKKYKNFIEQTSEGISYLEFESPIDISLPREVKVKKIYETGVIAECNLAFAKMYGFDSIDEILGKKLIDMHGDDENPMNLKAFYDFCDSNYNVQNVVTEENGKEGNKIFFLNNSVGIIKSNLLYGIWGTQIDISERQKSEELVKAAYRISEAAHTSDNLDDLFKSIHNIVSTLMPAKNFYIAIYDSKKDLISFPYFIDEYDELAITQKPGRGITEYVIRSGKPLLATPAVIKELEAKNEIIPIGSESVDWLGVPLKVNNSTIGILAVQSYTEGIRYTTDDMHMLVFVSNLIAMAIERKRAEEALKFSESKNRALLSALPDMMFVQNYDGVYLDYHARSPEMLISGPEKFMGKNMSEVLPKYMVDLFKEGFKKAIESGEIQLVEYPLEIRGVMYHFEARFVAYDNDKILTTIRDVSQKEKMVNELLEAKEKAEEMNQIKSNFLANMSHELRTPLHGILGFAQILADDLDNPDHKNMITTIYRSGKRLLETLNLILSFSKADAKKYNLVYSVVNVKQLVHEVVELSVPNAESKSINLTCDICDEDIFAELDARLIRDILHNLINNAIKFTEKGGVIVKVSTSGNELILKVLDSGIGIPEDKFDIIFQEFRQESEGLSRNFEGTGLGLTLTKNYVELLKGTITVESTIGKGSIFTVILPLKNIQEMTIASGESDDEMSVNLIPAPDDKRNILLVENDRVSAVLVRAYISGSYNIDIVAKGNDALTKTKEKRYDAILMDINLGEGMTGIEVTQKIKKLNGYQNVPIIAVTAFAMETDKDEFLNYGCTHYIAKPFDRTELLNLLNSIFTGEA